MIVPPMPLFFNPSKIDASRAEPAIDSGSARLVAGVNKK
jgi:hypothetical protein